jgi:hypothetical protein
MALSHDVVFVAMDGERISVRVGGFKDPIKEKDLQEIKDLLNEQADLNDVSGVREIISVMPVKKKPLLHSQAKGEVETFWVDESGRIESDYKICVDIRVPLGTSQEQAEYWVKRFFSQFTHPVVRVYSLSVSSYTPWKRWKYDPATHMVELDEWWKNR